ncbi:MAG: hypothetical protein ACYS8X_09870 [Planctomycetota bacterium]|jgi:hypothetical protein
MTPSADTLAGDVAVEQMLLQDGEIIILSIKPSPWYVLLVSLPVLVASAVTVAVAAACNRFGLLTTVHPVIYAVATVCMVGRLVAAGVQWMGVRYVLTNHRMLRLRTFLSTAVYEVPLTLIDRAAVGVSMPERLVGVGSVCYLDENGKPFGAVWLCLADPHEVCAAANEAIDRYRQ